MFIGHYGASYAIKRWRPDISITALFIAVQLLDVGWSVFVFAGVEKVRIVPGITKTNSLDLYYMPYTHSLVAALLWAAISGTAYEALKRASYKHAAVGAGVLFGVAVFSHWTFDFIVHRPDLALYDNTAKVGLGFWNYRWPAFFLEIGLLIGGLVLYLRGGRAIDRIGRIGPWAFVVLLVAVQAMVFFGGSLGSPNQAALIALASYAGFAAIARWLDHHRTSPAGGGMVRRGRSVPALPETGAAAAPRP